MALNLEKQLQVYGAHHHDRTNIAIHMLCVPAILLTSFVFLANTPAPPVPAALQLPHLPANAATLAGALYAALYVLLEPVAGAACTQRLVAVHGGAADACALGVFVAAWAAQLVGHGRFERRAPALRENLAQALFLAPLFVWLEVLFALGYRPGLKRRVDEAVERDIRAFRAAKGKAEGVQSR